MNIQNITPRDLFDMAMRRKWFIISSLVLSLAVAAAVALLTPKIYRSFTSIIVETQRIPERYVNSVISGAVSDRLTVVQQIVLSRTFLDQISREFQLYSPQATESDREQFIEGLRKNIKIETKAQRGDVRVESFTLSFAHNDPVVASRVTDRLAAQIISENLKTRELLVEGTTKFLQDELAQAAASLEAQERAIAQFKKKHMGELPVQTAANLQTLDRLQRELANVNDALQNRNDRRAATLKMINSYELMGLANMDPVREVSASAPSEDTGRQRAQSPPRGAARASASDPLAQRLRELERQLATLSAEYKDTYPDVIQTKQEIAQLKLRVAERNASLLQEEAERPEPARPTENARPSTLRRPSSGSIDPYVHELKREREELDIGITNLREQQHRLQAQIRDFELRVERAPEREQELLVLERDYTNTKRNYDSLLDKQLSARVSENLERRQQGETFRVIDPANVPIRPESPDQTKILLVGLLIGCGLGFGGAFALEQLAGVVQKVEDVESLLGLPVIASIPDFKTAYKTSSKARLLEEYKNKYSPQMGRNEIKNGWRPSSSGNKDAYAKGKAVYQRENGDERGQNGMRSQMNLVAKWRPQSLVAEQFRVAATRLVLSSAGKKLVVVVTSALPGEGKSSSASNLAYVLAHDLGKQVLLIDCDFKRPVLHTYNQTPLRPGLAEAIYGDAALENCLHRSGESSLWILPSGRRDHQMVDLTKISQLTTIVKELKERFEFILLDAPPIVPVADMNLLASIADMLLLVVRAGVTPLDVLGKAVNAFRPLNRGAVIVTGMKVSGATMYMQDVYASQETTH